MPTFPGTLGPDSEVTGFDILYGLDGRDFLAATTGALGYIEGGTGGDAIFVQNVPGELYGGSGNDQIGGWQLADTLYGGSGGDLIAGGFATRVNDNFLPDGPSGADLLSGDGGSDALFGFDGNDVLYGGDGDDSGTVTMDFFVPFTVDAGLWGGDGDDLIDGGVGNDDLHGEAGSDFLIGGLGADRFFFDTAPGGGVDTVRDFDRGADGFVLSAAAFTGIGSPGALQKKAFANGKKAADKNDHLLYDQKSGKVFFDADGKGGSKAVLFAQVEKGVKLTAADFDVIA